VTISHEVCETALDPDVTAWSQMPDGRLEALELCDRVEGDSYTTMGISVSNFLFPEAFRDRASDVRFDHMRKLEAARDMTPGGYRILMAGGKVSQEFASDQAARAFLSNRAKAHPAGRTQKRLRA
jgi:hypothetical protein